jgi:transposase InsO family protein
VSVICAQLNRSREWFYVWWRRYQSGAPEWYQEQSREPDHSPNRISDEMIQEIVQARKLLSEQRGASKDAQAIWYYLRRKGLNDVPVVRTIAREIARQGLVQRAMRYQKRGTPYPAFVPKEANEVHQADLVGPRHLGGGPRFYLLLLMDVLRRYPSIRVVTDRQQITLVTALLSAWEDTGLPSFLQIDNTLATGEGRYPGSISRFLRLCLKLGIQVVFIPPREPWRNGIIERFADRVQRDQLRSTQFVDLAHLQKEIAEYQRFCREDRVLSALGGKTPNETCPNPRLRSLQQPFQVQLDQLPILPGKIHFVRLVRSDLKLTVLKRTFSLPAELIHQYVTATLSPSEQQLTVRCDDQIIEVFRFPIPGDHPRIDGI